jgi:hypothetical protein
VNVGETRNKLFFSKSRDKPSMTILVDAKVKASEGKTQEDAVTVESRQKLSPEQRISIILLQDAHHARLNGQDGTILGEVSLTHKFLPSRSSNP